MGLQDMASGDNELEDSTANDPFQEAKRRIVSVVRCTYIKRALHNASQSPKLNFWRVIQGSLLDAAVLDWCVLFGADSERAHWKKLIPADKHDEFRSMLLKEIGCDESEWQNYREDVKAYRDKHLAHLGERDKEDTYPTLDIALNSSNALYKWLRAQGQIFEGPNRLDEYGQKFYEQSKTVAAKAVSATIELEEDVG
jgi:hypothetical protein